MIATFIILCPSTWDLSYPIFDLSVWTSHFKVTFEPENMNKSMKRHNWNVYIWNWGQWPFDLDRDLCLPYSFPHKCKFRYVREKSNALKGQKKKTIWSWDCMVVGKKKGHWTRCRPTFKSFVTFYMHDWIVIDWNKQQWHDFPKCVTMLNEVILIAWKNK